MPLFKFNRRKKLSLNRKSSSMGTIYQDYSGDPPLESGIINGHSKHGDHGMNLGGSSLDAIEPAADRLKKADSAPEKRFQERGVDTACSITKASSTKESPDSSDVILDLRTQNQILSDENNLLKLKVEILLDMLAQKTAELDVQESSLLQMKNILANS